MKVVKYIVIVAVLAFLAGCSDPAIDGSSDEAFKNSIAKVRSSLPEAQRDDFDKAVMAAALGDGNFLQLAAAGKDAVAGQMRSRLDGKTAKEVLAFAAELHAKQKQERIAELQKKVDALAKKRAGDEAASKELGKFTVSDTGISQAQRQIIGKIITLRLTVRNGTATPVSRVAMRATVFSEGRAIPWLEESVNYTVAGGVEPGESKTWELNPNMFGKWSSLEVTPEMRVRIDVTGLDGPGETPIAKLLFSDTDRKDLAQAEAELAQALKVTEAKSD